MFIIYDTEYLSDEGSLERRWQGIDDPPPHLVQLAAIKVERKAGLKEIDRLEFYVRPEREGKKLALSSYFSKLTGITESIIDEKAISLSSAMDKLADFAGNAPLFSYGYDQLLCLSPSCYLQNIPNPLACSQFADIRKVFFHAGIDKEELLRLSSGSLVDFFSIRKIENLHNAMADSYSILLSLRHLESQGLLDFKLLQT